MAIVRRSVEFNSADSVAGTNAFDAGPGNTTINIQTNTGVELQGAGSTTEKVDNATITQCLGEINGNTPNGRFGCWIGSNTWGEITSASMALKFGGQGTQNDYNIPTSYWPYNSGYIPVWQVGATTEAVGYTITANNLPGGAGDNVFLDNVTYIPNNDWPYVINGTSTISDLATAERVKSTGFNQTCVEENGIYFFYAGIVIGWDGTATPVLTDFTFSETGETFVIVNVPTMTVVTGSNHSRWTVRMDATNPSFTMTSCNYLAGEAAKASRVHNVELVFTGTNGTATIDSCNLLNLDSLVLTSVCEVKDSTITAVDITQGSADIHGNTITCDTASGVALIDDPTFGTSTGLYNNTFIKGDSGHAIEISSVGSPATLTLTNIRFSGFNATTGNNNTPNSGPNDAAIYNNTGGALQLVISGGDVPSVRNGPGATTTVVSTRQLTIDNIQPDSEVRVYDYTNINDPTTFTEIAGVELAQSPPDSSTFESVTAYTDSDGNTKFRAIYNYDTATEAGGVRIVAVNIDYNYFKADVTLPTNSDFSLSLFQISDRNYDEGGTAFVNP